MHARGAGLGGRPVAQAQPAAASWEGELEASSVGAVRASAQKWQRVPNRLPYCHLRYMRRATQRHHQQVAGAGRANNMAACLVPRNSLVERDEAASLIAGASRSRHLPKVIAPADAINGWGAAVGVVLPEYKSNN